MTINGLTLTSRSGNTVDVLAATQNAEFMHLNGAVEPLLTATVPQDTYVSAKVSVSYASYTCIANTSSGLGVNEYAVQPPANATVNLAGPITISGAGTALLLSLDTLQSAHYSTCDAMAGVQGGPPPSTTSLTPVFDLSLETLAAQPTSSTGGKAADVSGIVSAVNAAQGKFEVSSSDGLTWPVSTTGSTVFQGISGISALSAGMAVDMDLAIQADGSLLADRLAVPDTETSNLTTFGGGVTVAYDASSAINLYASTYQGALLAKTGNALDGPSIDSYLDVTSTRYQWSGRFTNVNNLPFTASFDGSSIVAGQNIYVTNHLIYSTCCQYDPATTITLMPQTIDGTITAIASAGGFTTYTVSLAGYDSFPTLAVQPGQTTLLQKPNSVVVYVDSSTQMLNATAASVGNVLRFNGLIFNDKGTLRMDCAEILDGVAQ